MLGGGEELKVAMGVLGQRLGEMGGMGGPTTTPGSYGGAGISCKSKWCT